MRIIAGLLVLLLGGQAAPQDLVISGTAGFGGCGVRGERAPVQVEIDNRGPDREIILALTWGLSGDRQDGSPTLDSLGGRRGPLHSIPVTLAAGSRKVISATLVAPDADNQSLWAFSLTPAGKMIAGGEIRARLVPPSSKLVGIVGDDRPSGLNLPNLEKA